MTARVAPRTAVTVAVAVLVALLIPGDLPHGLRSTSAHSTAVVAPLTSWALVSPGVVRPPLIRPPAAPRKPLQKRTVTPLSPVPVVLAAPTHPSPALSSPTICANVPPLGSARQVVMVRAASTSATIEACTWDGGMWKVSLGPYRGHVGYNGVAYGGSKREGDGRTPAGVYPLAGGFGVQSNPGLLLGWLTVRAGDVWVDDPTSPLYNTWQRTPVNGRWASAENLDNPGAYSYAQIVAFNTQRTPYAGSAIFLHADGGGPTAGCVALPVDALLLLFRWERPGVVIAIN